MTAPHLSPRPATAVPGQTGNAVTYGSLCSGYEGIGLGLQLAGFDLDIRWQAENDKHAAKILDARFPGVPNLGDIKTTDWSVVEPVEIITAGWPCQPFSDAGKRKGTDDERHLWPYVAAAIGALRPRWFIGENVRGHLSLGFDSVLCSLARLGYDATWGVVRASDAGAPHGRARVFILATDTCGLAKWSQDRRESRWPPGEPARHPSPVADTRSARLRQHAGEPSTQEARPYSCNEPSSHGSGEPANADGERRQWDRSARRWGQRPPNGSVIAADPASDGRDEGRPEPARLVGGLDVAERGPAVTDAESDEGRQWDGDDGIAWGAYRPAIQRWERVTGRRAPRPTEAGSRGGQRLAPVFVEWMQGLPLGWVTDIDIPRNAKLAALGNGVVPQQCALAVTTLLEIEARERAA